MADRIELINGRGQLAYRSEVPWHTKGYGLTQGDLEALSGMTLSQQNEWWRKAAQIDFKVDRRLLAMSSHGPGMLTEPLKGYRAITRQDTNQVFQLATEKYHPVQNEEIVKFFLEYCDAGNAQLETVGAIDGGGKIWALAKLLDSKVGTSDLKTTYALIATSHDGTLPTIAKGTDVYVVCWNTLSAAIGVSTGYRKEVKGEKIEFRLKHTSKWTPERAKEAKRTLGIFVEQSQESTEVAEKLSKVSIDRKGQMEFVRRLIGGESMLEQVASNTQDVMSPMGSSILDSIVANHHAPEVSAEEDLGRLGKAILESILTSPGCELPERANTLWGAVNGVTYHVDHQRGRTQDNRLDSAWFGNGNTLKRDAVKVALEIAG